MLIVLLVGVGSFYAGTKYATRKGGDGSRIARMQGQGLSGGTFGRAMGGGAGRGTAGGFVTGEVLMKDANTITVKMRDGGSKIIFFSSSTTMGKMAVGSIDDLTQGTQVVVNGTTNQDGSVSATMVQIRPEGEAVGFGPGGMVPVQR